MSERKRDTEGRSRSWLPRPDRRTVVGGILIAATAAVGITEAVSGRFGHGEVECSKPSKVIFDAFGNAVLPEVLIKDGSFVDSKDGRSWKMIGEDWSLSGRSPGVFQGWVDENSIPKNEREKGVCWGRFANSSGMGIVGFKPKANPRG